MKPLVVALVLAIGCSGTPLERSLERGIAWFAREQPPPDPSWSYVLGHLERRFGLAVPLRNAPVARASGTGSLYERLADPQAPADARAIAALASPIDRMTALALHCDRLALPTGWNLVLSRASAAGGYALTHAVLARMFTLENGCLPPAALAALASEQNELLVALAARGDAAPDARTPSRDIWLEALALLHAVGARERVRPEWIEALQRAQRDDGGWGLRPDTSSHPHATALALWVLLERLHPDAPPLAWIPRPAAPGR